MFKTIILYIVVFTLVGTTSYFIHNQLLGTEHFELKALLKKAYLFHAIFSLSIIIAFQLASNFDSVFPQLGFIYMGLLVFKIMVFTMMFYPQLVGDQMVSRFYRGSILIPVAIFLILEVVFVTKILRRK
ncbi:DUF6168 family protein [Cytophaga sp. FL35]|uniref:DUF6168 family protein n=1 Tax=Cytophaga sp. FL35 TaxID=1904456 RepID=UPI001CA40306